MKLIFKIAVCSVFIIVAAFFLLKVPDTDPQRMIDKYGQGAIRIDDGLGGNIYYRDQGPADAPVLLLIHGSNSSMQTWNAMIELLDEQYRLISYDLHGHGLSGPHANNDYSASAQIETALTVLDAAGVDKAIWVGNSMGGWLSWRAGLAVPERVSGLVLIDASGVQGGEKQELYLAARIIKSRAGQFLANYITPRSIVESSLTANYFDDSLINDALIDQYWELSRFPGNRAAIAHRANVSREPHVWNQIHNIDVPTLILWGEKDKVTPFSDAKRFQEMIVGSELVSYCNASHLPMEETPLQVAMDIDRWVSERFSEPEVQ